jgi:integrase
MVRRRIRRKHGVPGMAFDRSYTVERGGFQGVRSGRTSNVITRRSLNMKPGKVYVKKVAGKPFLQLAWIDPDRGNERRRSTKTNRMREAASAADALEKTIWRGVPIDGIGWFDFCERYKGEHVATLKRKSQSDWPTVQISITAILAPVLLKELTPSAVSIWSAKLRKQGKTRGVIARYLRTIRTALRWAERIRLIHEAPYIAVPKREQNKKRMKGRPITLEEFERMLKAVPVAIAKMVPPKATAAERRTIVQSWRHLLCVYWFSGIRLDEATQLYWDRPDKLCIQNIDRKHPTMLIQEELEKGNEDRIYPLTPDFVEYLRRTPESERTGRICQPLTLRGVTSSYVTIGRTVSAIGKGARVVVNTAPRKYASAHDLRRSFGSRWAPLVQPPILQQLMRHKHLSTTMTYYVELRASETSAVLQEAYVTSSGDLLGDPRHIAGKAKLKNT